MKLNDLGPRICILGPSNSGKSTLANTIALARGREPVHLDQLCHLPNTDWQLGPQEDFRKLHDEAILGPRWVIDGNYTRCLPQRLDRATGVIRLGISTPKALFRYFRRCWFGQKRYGALEGARERVKWEMLHYISIVNRKSRARNEALFQQIALPKIELSSPRALDNFYRAEGLSR